MDLAQGGPWWNSVKLEERILGFEQQYVIAHHELPSRDLVDEALSLLFSRTRPKRT